MSARTQMRIGIGRHAFKEPEPWYVTIYNHALTHDECQGWFGTHAEAVAFSDRLLRILRPTTEATR